MSDMGNTMTDTITCWFVGVYDYHTSPRGGKRHHSNRWRFDGQVQENRTKKPPSDTTTAITAQARKQELAL